MNKTIQQRVAELSATLLPISDYAGASYITSAMVEEAEDNNSYNSSFYCDGWVKPVFEGDFKGVVLQKVEDFQVLRMYFIRTRLEGLAYDEIPEDWDDFDAPDYPEMEITDVIEYKQLWFNKDEQFELIVNKNVDDYYRNEAYVVRVDSVQPWAFEPKYRQFIVDYVNEYKYDYEEEPLAYFNSPVCEMLINKVSDLHHVINECGFTEKAIRYYRSLRVAVRHGYRLPVTEQEARMYFDYLDMLNNKHICMTEPRYVCPADFTTEYHKLCVEREDRLRAYQEHITQQIEEQALKREQIDILKAEREEPAFAENHSWLFGINFEDENFCYQSLDSVEAYRLEGDSMHHCIFHCGYYTRPYMLALHISDHEGNRVATCTINLNRRKIDAIQPMCNDTGFFKTYGIRWQETNDYKHIWNTLMARMHTFPTRKPKQTEQQQIKVA